MSKKNDDTNLMLDTNATAVCLVRLQRAGTKLGMDKVLDLHARLYGAMTGKRRTLKLTADEAGFLLHALGASANLLSACNVAEGQG